MVWFEASNQYIVMEIPGYEVFTQLNQGASNETIAKWCSKTYGLDASASFRFVKEIKEFIYPVHNNTTTQSLSNDSVASPAVTTEHFFSEKKYQFAGSDFCFKFSHKQIETMIHPLISHLEINSTNSDCHQFHLFRHADSLFLRTNKALIGEWSLDNEHFFKGKVFLELLNKAYQKAEGDWMAVMHGSAITDGEHCIILTGDSGKGKSTALAVMLANGFKFLSDDFVPVEANSGKAYQFPTAISIKAGAVKTLIPIYPELDKAEEFYYAAFDKTVRYLPPHISQAPSLQSYPVKAIVYIDYEAGAELEVANKLKTEAIQNVITESWLSPLHENAERFLDWAISLPYYKLKYSDNHQMITAITKLFNDKQK